MTANDSQEITVATICMNSRDHVPSNFEHAVALIREAASKGADWVLLPEIFLFNGPYSGFSSVASKVDQGYMTALSQLSKELGIILFAGTIHETSDDSDTGKGVSHTTKGSAVTGEGKVYNTLVVFGRSGEIIEIYRKIHLFNLYGDDGNKVYCESDGFLAGREPKVVSIDGFCVGLTICYDLRFPELFLSLSTASSVPCDVFVVPAAFTKSTGEAHWQLLLKARAVENQAFVIAANQTGESYAGKECYGHSMVIDPWGDTLCDTLQRPGVALATISKKRLHAVRGQLPALKNRRPEIYTCKKA